MTALLDEKADSVAKVVGLQVFEQVILQFFKFLYPKVHSLHDILMVLLLIILQILQVLFDDLNKPSLQQFVDIEVIKRQFFLVEKVEVRHFALEAVIKKAISDFLLRLFFQGYAWAFLELFQHCIDVYLGHLVALYQLVDDQIAADEGYQEAVVGQVLNGLDKSALLLDLNAFLLLTVHQIGLVGFLDEEGVFETAYYKGFFAEVELQSLVFDYSVVRRC